MSRRSRRNAQTSPSLFPFLAVLICTMGAIIVLLVLVVKNADVQATAASETNEQERTEERQKWQDRLDLEQSQIETLQELRPDLKERLDKEKTVAGHLVDHVSRLRRELDRLTASLDQLNVQTNAGDPTAENIQAELDRLTRQIETANQELATQRKELTTARPAFSIIPKSQGGNGTFRRPIFVECDEYGITLQPYGIKLGPGDFPRTLGPNNPLDRALLMIRDYWNQLDPNRAEGQPYPLFVVRPSGSKSFAAARKAMKSWVDEFGYELVSADVEIKYPDADQNFKKRLESAIELARTEQKNRMVAISRQEALGQIRRLENRSGSSGSGQGYRASSVGGGFVAEKSTGTVGGSNRSSFSNVSQSRSVENPINSGFRNKPSLPNQNNGQSANGKKSSKSDGSQKNGTRNSAFVPGGQLAKSSAEGGEGGPNASPSSGGEKSAVPSLPPESIARSRGTDWALPSKSNNSIQVRKPIKVQVNQDSIKIVEIGKGVRTIPLGESTSTAVPALIELVWKHIDAWGIAGVNSYWKPTLNMYVAPDAQSRYNDLQILLSGSGLDMRRASR